MSLLIVMTFCVAASFASGQPEPGFDPREIVRRVRDGCPVARTAGIDDGEFLIDTSVVYTPAPGGQREPAAAFDGENFLVVWEDDRDNRYYHTDIYGARVTPDGTVLDSCSIPISRAPGIQGHPSVAFDGANFLVVWEDYRRDEYDIYGARVTPSGVVLDPSGIPVCQAAAYQYAPDVAFNGTGFLVVWRDYRRGGGYDVYGARVTADGVVLDSAGIALSTASGDQMEPAVAFDGTNSLVVWQDERTGDRDIYGTRVTPAGDVLDSAGIHISQAAGYQSFPAVAFDGTNLLVVWIDSRNGGSDIYGARITPAGVVLDSAGIGMPRTADRQLYPAVTFDGTDFLVVWQEQPGDSFDIYAARVASSGVVLDSTGILVSDAAADEWYPAVACDGSNSLVVWGDGTSEIFGARVTPQGVLLDTSGIAISGTAHTQQSPAVAFDGLNFLVVWADMRGADYDIYGARVTQTGTVLDPAGFAISQAVGYQSYPAVAFDGADYLVVWENGRNDPDIYGARVTPAGVVLDTTSIPISCAASAQGKPAVAFDGTNSLVVWEGWHGGAPSDIYGARVTPDGVVLDPSGIVVSQAEGYQYTARVASDGTNSFVVWTEQRSGSRFDICGARVTPSGIVLDPSGIVICQDEEYQYDPAVAFDGTNYLVVWADERAIRRGDTSDIFGARVTPAGTVMDPEGIHIAQAEHAQELPDVTFDGADFVVVWQDHRNGWYQDVYGALVSQGGVVSGSGPVVQQDGHQEHAALARGTGDQLFLAYQGWAGTVGGRAYNTDRIWGKLGPLLGLAEESPDGGGRITHDGPTIICNVLFLPGSTLDIGHSSLLDALGRSVLDLVPGPNDVSHLAPGVYFVQSAIDVRHSAITKVVITR